MHRPAVLCAMLALGCAQRSAPVPIVEAPMLEDANVRAVMQSAVRADAAGQAADTLYLVGAVTVANGVPVMLPPRFAGVRAGGTATVTSTTLEITPYFAWGALEYRWTARTGGQAVYGRATFVLERAGGSWRIKHLHTSSLR